MIDNDRSDHYLEQCDKKWQKVISTGNVLLDNGSQ